MRKYILVLASFVLITAVKAQEVWTLEKCVEYALTNNISVKQQMLLVKSGQASLQQDKLGMLPSLNGGISHGYNFGQTIDRYTNQFATSRVQTDNFYVGSRLTLFQGFQQLNQVKQRKIDLEATNFDLDQFMDDLSLNIATGYLQILYFRELVKTNESQLKTTEMQAERLKELVDAGARAKGDFYNIEAQRAAENSQVVSARNDLSISYLTLTQLMDLPTTEGFEIEVPDLELGLRPDIGLTPDQIYGMALETQPSIKGAEARVKSSEYGLSIAQGAQSPTITVEGSLGSGYSGIDKVTDTATGTTSVRPFDEQMKNNYNRSFSFNLNVPIFNGWATRTNITKAKINIENQKYSLDQDKLRLRKTIQQAYADANAALNNYDASLVGVNASRESFRYAEQKFSVGAINSVDYNSAKNDLDKAESDLLRAKFEFIFKTTVLDFYMGKPLSLKRK